MKDLNKRIEKIKKMENIMNEQNDLLDRLNDILDEFEEKQDSFVELIKYYSSQEWFDDHDLMENNELPEDLACGVLGEDYPYDVIGSNLHIGFRMVELADKVFKTQFNN